MAPGCTPGAGRFDYWLPRGTELLAGRTERETCVRSKPESPTNTDLAEKVRSILARRNLTLYQASQQSAALYGRSSPYFLPHNLYYELRRAAFNPSIYQFVALSRISGYRLADWLHVFGFDLENIPRLQVLLPSNRTILLDSSLEDPNSWVPWLRNRAGNAPAPPIAPLAQLLEVTRPRRLRSMPGLANRGFLYAKIGHQDALAFPDLLPGSIVRVNPRLADDSIARTNGTTTGRIFLVEHSKGFFCSRLRVAGDGLVMPVSAQLPYAQIELRLPHEARLLGAVDLELRPLLKTEQPEVPKELAKHWNPRPLPPAATLGQLLRSARAKMHFSLREASAISQRIADLLGDEQYFIAHSSLFDHEVLDAPPRHFHKAITLCLLYGLQFHALLKAIGIDPDKTGAESMPDHLISRLLPARARDSIGGNRQPAHDGFLEELLRECGGVPFFLRESIGALSGLTAISLDDVFWIGGERTVFHPYLTNGLLVIVNRRRKKPLHSRLKPLWQQPLYVILKRDGTYLCACCGVENGTLVVHPYSQHLPRPAQFRYRQDAEVVGQIVTIARKLL